MVKVSRFFVWTPLHTRKFLPYAVWSLLLYFVKFCCCCCCNCGKVRKNNLLACNTFKCLKMPKNLWKVSKFDEKKTIKKHTQIHKFGSGLGQKTNFLTIFIIFFKQISIETNKNKHVWYRLSLLDPIFQLN